MSWSIRWRKEIFLGSIKKLSLQKVKTFKIEFSTWKLLLFSDGQIPSSFTFCLSSGVALFFTYKLLTFRFFLTFKIYSPPFEPFSYYELSSSWNSQNTFLTLPLHWWLLILRHFILSGLPWTFFTCKYKAEQLWYFLEQKHIQNSLWMVSDTFLLSPASTSSCSYLYQIFGIPLMQRKHKNYTNSSLRCVKQQANQKIVLKIGRSKNYVWPLSNCRNGCKNKTQFFLHSKVIEMKKKLQWQSTQLWLISVSKRQEESVLALRLLKQFYWPERIKKAVIIEFQATCLESQFSGWILFKRRWPVCPLV